MGGDTELADFLMFNLGYALIGENHHQSFVIAIGKGGTGKSTTLDVVGAILGSDYADIITDDVFLKQKGSKPHPCTVKALENKRYLYTSEVEKGTTWDEANLKKISGGDQMFGREMWGGKETFESKSKPFLATNEAPEFEGNLSALKRRIHIIPFEVPVHKEGVILNMKKELLKESEGILNRLVQYAVIAYGSSPKIPEVCQRLKDQILVSLPEKFINEYLIEDPDATTTIADLNKYRNQFPKFKKIPKKNLNDALEDKGHVQDRDSSSRFWRGFRFKDDLPEEDESA